MQHIDLDEFRARSRDRGFDEVVERSWDAGVEVKSHSHPFSVEAVVVAGEMWLTIGAQTRHLRPGDTFTLDRDTPHAERYGPSGATYWAARRN
jgi:quercetin dioxygenase-like cupin family protein